MRLRSTQRQKKSRWPSQRQRQRQKLLLGCGLVGAKVVAKAKAKVSAFVIACLRSASSTGSRKKKQISSDMRLSNVSAINRQDRQKETSSP